MADETVTIEAPNSTPDTTGVADAPQQPDAPVSGDGSLLGDLPAADKGDGDASGDKPEGADDGGKGDAKPDAETGPPEAYALTMPEGVELDAEVMAVAAPVLKELGLTNEQASKLVPIVQQVQERMANEQTSQFAALSADWAKQAKADPEMGGQNWKVTEQNAARALDMFAGPASAKNDKGEDVPNAFRAFLNETKMGNHPEFIRLMARVGAAAGEDSKFVRGEGAPPVKQDPLEARYPNDPPKK